MDWQETIRKERHIPIRELGRGQYGRVYLAYNLDQGFVAVKIDPNKRSSLREFNTSVNLDMLTKSICTKVYTIYVARSTTNISYGICQSKMEGIKVFHSVGLVHRDIKCDNILLHSPPGTGRVHIKISDFGFALKEEEALGLTYLAGTLPYMPPELFQESIRISQKVDIYSIGITFYLLVVHKFPVNGANYSQYQAIFKDLKFIERPSEIEDDQLWDILSQMLQFDSIKRLTATDALKHPFFTTPEALADISPEQQELASQAIIDQGKDNYNITEYDVDPTFIVAQSVIQHFMEAKSPHQLEQSFHLNSSQVHYTTTQTIVIPLDSTYYKNSIYSSNQANSSQDSSLQLLNQNSDGLFGIAQQNYSQTPLVQSESFSQQLNPISKNDHQTYNSNPQTYQSYTQNEQQDAEASLIALNMTLEQINDGLQQIEKLSFIERDILFANLNQRLKNIQMINRAFQLGIVDNLLQILHKLPIQDLYPITFQPLVTVLQKGSDEQRKILYKKRLLSWGIRFLDSENEGMILRGFIIIKRLLYFIENPIQEGEMVEQWEELQFDDFIANALKLFYYNSFKNIKIKQYAASVIGRIHKAKPIPSEYGPEIINYLKETMNDSDQYVTNVELQTLQFIAECQCIFFILQLILYMFIAFHQHCYLSFSFFNISLELSENHHLIISKSQLIEMNKILTDDQKIFCYIGIINLFRKLFKFGTLETREEIRNKISIDRIKFIANFGNDNQKNASKQMIKNHYENVIVHAGRLLEMINEYELNKNLKTIQQDQKDKNIEKHQEIDQIEDKQQLERNDRCELKNETDDQIEVEFEKERNKETYNNDEKHQQDNQIEYEYEQKEEIENKNLKEEDETEKDDKADIADNDEIDKKQQQLKKDQDEQNK